jgi:nucleotide-binding universal stress UspA family protein
MNTAPTAIVVAVGSDGSESALQYAVTEARRTGRSVHLVHVLQLPAGEAYAAVYGGALDASRATLDEALDRAGRLAGDDVTVTGELIDDGWLVDDLVRKTGPGQVLVMQHRAFSRTHRLFTGSIVQSVAGRAHAPVVSVPEGWTPGEANVVTAAVQDPDEAPALLRIAFEEARARTSSLVVLHAWWLASGYDVAVVDEAMRAEWSDRTRVELAPVLLLLQAEFPDVPVTVEVRHSPPVEAVLDAAATSDLLVLGRRHHRLPLSSHLGPVARAAIAHAGTPVLITPELGVAEERAHEPSRPYAVGEMATLY